MNLQIAIPWRDRAGRFSAFKALVFGALFLPGIWVLYKLTLGPPMARPITEAIHELGLWAIRLLLISLALTPLRQIGRWPQVALVRRMIGVAGFAYLALHFAFYIVDLDGNLLRVGSEIVLRFYLTIGFIALVILAALAATSTDGMLKRLGGPRWRRLHKGAYLAAILGSWHFFLQAKADVGEAIWMMGLTLWLLAYRPILWKWDSKIAAHPGVLAGLGLLATLATAIFEVSYLHLRVNAPLDRLIAAQFDWGLGVRPAWVVGGICLVALLIALIRRGAEPARSRLKTVRS
ncbi:sulfite oxidase heme-binding subunit YedZ [Lacibacterium aquatile]|uniref:Protein-methionine-sulfoxide reductase heme-binding subunit MsrQ n=1 Tax=Lacibacterium aquatile TaxID=1168082 RepID=A0ABW5DRP3_9PROT